MNETTKISWSAEQQAIFNWFKTGTGSLVVQARAGTGKTTTIKEAFSYAPEDSILYAVFNKKNQVEASAKITDNRVAIKTLHSLGYSYILSMWSGVKPDQNIERARVCAEREYPYEVVTQVCRLVGFAKNTLVAPTVEDLISIALDREIEAGEEFEAEENGGYTVERLANMAMAAIELSKVRNTQGLISFDDMVWLPVAMGWVRARYDLVVVDECQDMCAPQLLMARGACKKAGRVCIVGDDRQAIYGFRGADTNGMQRMKERLNAATLGLTTTYRCPKAVVALAAELVPDYKAADSAPEGIVDDVSADDLLSHVKLGDAILSRTNAPLMPLCLSLLRGGVAARIEGKDVGAMLRAIVKKFNAKSVPDFLRKVEVWRVKKIARLSAAGHKNRIAAIEDQAETLVAVAEGCTSVREIDTRLFSLFADTETGSKPCVVLSTVHKAKGLEWGHVFILTKTFRSRSEQEANVYYVALTRAQKQLSFVA